MRAGYSDPNIGRQLITIPHVAARVQELEKAALAANALTPDFVLAILRKEAEGKGPDTNSSARIKAAELIGKHLTMWRDKEAERDDGKVLVNLAFQPLTPDEIEGARQETARG